MSRESINNDKIENLIKSNDNLAPLCTENITPQKKKFHSIIAVEFLCESDEEDEDLEDFSRILTGFMYFPYEKCKTGALNH